MTGIEAELGVVTSVDSKSVGSPVVGGAVAGDQTLFVNDNVDFSPGDEVLVTPIDGAGELYVIGAVDDEAGITLTSPLMEDAPEGTWVATVPLQFETIAEVRMVQSGEVLPCVVLHTLSDALRPGIRDESTAESVLVIKVGGRRYVFDVIARQTVRDISEALPGVPPAKPDAPVLSTLAYLDASKRLRAQITAAWSPVTTNEDGSDITDLDRYEVQTMAGTGGWQTYTSTPGDVTQAFIRDLEPGSTWSVRVRAVDTSKNAGEWSDPATITAATDNLPPSQPSRPVLASRLGVITITWDGKNATGGAMEDDLAYVEVHLSTTSGFTPTAGGATKIDQIPRAASVVWGPAAFGTTYYVKFVAVDTSGNASTASLQQSTAVAPLVDVSNFPDDAMQTLYARTGHFITVDADQINGNSAAIEFLETGIITSAIFEAKSGGEFRTYTPNPLNPTSPPSGGGIRIRDADGFMAWANGGGTPTVQIDRNTGILTARGGNFNDGTVSGGEMIGTTVTSTSGTSEITLSGGQLRFGGNAYMMEALPYDLFISGGAGQIGFSSLGIDIGGAVSFSGNVEADGTIISNATGTASGSEAVRTAGRVKAHSFIMSPSQTGGSTANCFVDTGGVVFRITSSLRYKNPIRKAEMDDVIEGLRNLDAEVYTRKDDPRELEEIGYYAERLDELGLTPWVQYDDEGQPDGVGYDRLVIPILAWNQKLEARVDELEQRITDLEEAAWPA